MKTISSGGLTVKVSTDREGYILALEGRVTEESDLVGVICGLSGGLTLDLGDLRFINSIGLRNWVQMLQRLEREGRRVVIRRCCEPMVMNMSMIPETLGHARVVSFMAPHECNECGLEEVHCIEVVAWAKALAQGTLPAPPCKECGEPMELSEAKERYAQFVPAEAAARQATG